MKTQTNRDFSPIRIMVITLGGIFLAEILAMTVVYLIRPLPYVIETIIDAAIMVMMIFPVVYYFSYRPLLTNINQRKQVEKALWESNEFLERMFSLTHICLAYLDTDFNFIRVNRAYAAADEREPEFYIGKNHFALFPNDENRSIFQEVVQTGEPHFAYAKPFEYAEHPERGVSYWDWSLIPTKTEQGEITGLVFSLVDVTPREKAQLALLESEQRFGAIFNQTYQFIALVEPDGTLLEINQAALDAAGLERARVIGMPIWEALNYNITPQTKRRFRNVIEQAAQGDFIRYEGHMTDIKLETIVVDYSLKPVKNSSGEVTLIIAEGRDITERKRMELALENEQQRLYTLLDSLPAFVALQSLDYSVRFANQRFHQRFGDPADKLCYQLMFGFSEPCQDCLIPEVIEKKEPRIWEKTYPDGKSFQIYGYPFYDKDQTPMVLELGVDITENKKAQAKIQQNAARAVALSETIESILEISPEYQGVLEEIVHSTAGLIGDGCVIRLISADRMTHRPAAFHHVNRETRRLLSRTLAKDVQPLEAGASGQVIRSGQPLFVPSIQKDQSDDYNISTHPTYLVDHHLHSLMCMPLRTRGDLIGTLTLFRDKNDRPYTQEDFLFVQNLSDQAALAIQNARLFEAELKARQTAEILRDASLALTQSLDLATVVNLFLDFAKQLAPYDWARVFLIEDETHLKLQAERGPDSLDAGQTLHFEPVGSSIFNDLLSDKQSILIPDTKIDSVPRTLNRESAQSWLGIPLAMEGHAIGLCIFESSRPGAFSEHHVQLLKALVGQVTVVIQNAWLFEQVRSGRGRLQSLSRKLVEVQESERRYVARELHDEASQALASLMVGLRLIERDADNPDSVLAGTGELKILTEKVMENLHRLAMDLRPASLDHLGLVTALRQYAKSISDRHHLLVQFEAIGVEDRLAADMETAIYRVVQEALSNVIRHAQATRVDVILEIRDSKLVIIVEDNGVGFNPLEIDQTQRLGLLGMRERVDMLEGTLTIESELGVGTTLFVEVPYGD